MEVVCGACGLFLLGVVVWSGLSGVQTAAANFAPTFVYVIFWLGLVVLSVLFGDVFRAFNPWRAAGKAVSGWRRGWPAARFPRRSPIRRASAAGRRRSASSRSPRFSWSAANGDLPENVAIAALVYSALTWIAMALYGVDAWIERGEAFSVYFNLFFRASPCSSAAAARWGCAARCRGWPPSARSREPCRCWP